LRNKIAKEFSEEFKRSYDEDINITSDILTNILKTVTLFRNACAHEERLYNFKLFKPAKSSLAGLFASYSNNFKTVRINDIQEMMGFKQEWKTIVLHNE